ncbi:hypothetical protein ACFXG4_04870 [Nocardia sp. NPDC059246]|uniref:hypothetical protein n=1 Tax=unclassified Nocardia TaxID=2637762 RepID=UPI003694D3DC
MSKPYEYQGPALEPGDSVGWVDRDGVLHVEILDEDGRPQGTADPFPALAQRIETIVGMSELWDWSKPARTYEVQPDGRVMLRVILTRGDQAKAVTPWHTGREPMDLDAAEIARDCDIPLSEVAGREFTATGDRTGLRDFQLVNDPRQ